MAGHYTLYYWGACGKKWFWGRATAPVLALEAAKAKGLDVDYEIKTPEEAPKDVGFAVPMLTLPSGQTMSQTCAILNVLGDRFGLNGTTEEERIKCQQTLLDLDDLFLEAEHKKLNGDGRADKWFGLLEKKLVKKFLVSDEPTVADFHAVFAFAWVDACYDGDYTEKFPKLTQYLKDIYEYGPVKEMKNSGVPLIPARFLK